AGLHSDPALSRARGYLANPGPTPPPDHAEYFYYGRFYAAQAAWQAGPQAWDAWYPSARDELLALQTPEGPWSDPNIGDQYRTAMALIVLQLPFDSVPLVSR